MSFNYIRLVESSSDESNSFGSDGSDSWTECTRIIQGNMSSDRLSAEIPRTPGLLDFGGENSAFAASSLQNPTKNKELKPFGGENSAFEASSVQNQTQKKKLKPTPSDKYDYVQSPVAHYIKKTPSKHDDFKVPTRPPKSTFTAPKFKSRPFKNIISPVGVYIRNGFQVLKQNLPVKTVSSLKPSKPSKLGKNDKENVFPEVVYKPGRKVLTGEKKELVLPSSIGRMVPKPVITKHESRAIVRGMSRCSISEKLLDGNLTKVDSSASNQSGEDVSFVRVKQAFMK